MFLLVISSHTIVIRIIDCSLILNKSDNDVTELIFPLMDGVEVFTTSQNVVKGGSGCLEYLLHLVMNNSGKRVNDSCPHDTTTKFH